MDGWLFPYMCHFYRVNLLKAGRGPVLSPWHLGSECMLSEWKKMGFSSEASGSKSIAKVTELWGMGSEQPLRVDNTNEQFYYLFPGESEWSE